MSAEEEIRITNLVRGIKSILKRRKYAVVSEEKFENYIDLHCEGEADSSDKLLARISLTDKVGVSLLRDYIKKLEENEGVKGLLVASNRFTHYARREAKEHGIWIITSKIFSDLKIGNFGPDFS